MQDQREVPYFDDYNLKLMTLKLISRISEVRLNYVMNLTGTSFSDEYF